MLDKIPKKSNLLFIRGVFPSDFTKKELDNTPAKTEIEPEYSEIPKKFTSVSTWIKKTNLLCWSCGLVPNNPDGPAFLPSNAEFNSNGQPICDPVGNFCEWPHVSLYIDTVMPEPQRSDLHKLVCIFEELFSGKRKEVIKAGPPKTRMKAYCGKSGLTEKQYRELLRPEYNLVEFDITNYKNQ